MNHHQSSGTKKTPRLVHHEHDDTIKSTNGRGETFGELLQRRISRRGVLKAGAAAGALAITGGRINGIGAPSVAAAAPEVAVPSVITFAPIPPQSAENQQIVVAPGHAWAPFLKWGEPLTADAPQFDPFNQSAEAQSQQAGYNCDFNGVITMPGYGDGRRAIFATNHEYTNPELMFPDFDPDNLTREQVMIQLAAHGMSIVEMHRGEEGPYNISLRSPLNRRITATTPIRFSGPAAKHPLLRTNADPNGWEVRGMLNNCAGGVTPWGTILTCEENFHQYFSNADLLDVDDARVALHERYGVSGGESDYKWNRYDARFDVSIEPNEPFRFGWVVEIDPFHPETAPVKRTALGRFRHEGATFATSPSGQIAFYSGDDQVFEYIYKYVSTDAYNALTRGMGHQLLDEGTLYVAKYNDDGTGEWMPLVYGEGPLTEENGFTSQGDVLIHTRQAADLLGATKMDRPEDVQQNPVTLKLYAAMTKNSDRGEEGEAPVDASNPRAANDWGHIIEMTEAGNDVAATTFTWDIFILCGDPNDESTYFADFPKEMVSPIANPDNLTFDDTGLLWVSTDGQPGSLDLADALHAVPTDGSQRGYVAQFLSVVVGAECSGPVFSEDYRNLFVSVQHPAEGSTFEEPITNWPGDTPMPRPTVIQIWNTEGKRVGGGEILPSWMAPSNPVNQ